MQRVWIELDKFVDPKARKKTIDGEVNVQRAALASRMLRRLGVAGPDRVFWSPFKSVYCFVIDSSGCYVEGVDNGHWFNLDFFAGPAPKPCPLASDENIGSIPA